MKYAGVVFRNVKNPLSSVKYEEPFDALLAGGVFLDEIVFLSYAAQEEIAAALARLSGECDGVFLVCSKVLLAAAKNAVSAATGTLFNDEVLLETERTLYAVLPEGDRGAEIAKSQVIPRADARRQNSYARVVIRTVSAPSETLDSAIAHAAEAGGEKLEVHASEKYGCARIEVIYDAQTPKMVADEVVRILAGELKDYVYALEDVSVAERLVEILKLHGKHIATAESFTGGGVGRELVRVPGASAVFYEGLNTYDNQSKKERLGVSDYTLMQHGAVSDETAYEMAAGLVAGGHCDISIATTGIAGPQSDHTNKPVGLCFIAIGTRERVRVFRFRLSGDRETITQTAINLALFLAYREVKRDA